MTAALIVLIYVTVGAWFMIEFAQRPHEINRYDGTPMLICLVFWPVLWVTARKNL